MRRSTKQLLVGLLCGISLTANAQNDPSTTVGDTGTVTVTYYSNPVKYTTVRAADGNIWMQQNLGSTQIATSATDAASYGDVFQWGRWDDGHQMRTSSTAATSTLSANNPSGLGTGSNLFYTGNNPNDWWGGGSGTDTWSANTPSATNGKDPCAALGKHWHIPTEAEWIAVATAEGITTQATAFSSRLKLPLAGQRDGGSLATLLGVGSYGNYWSSTPSGPYAKVFSLTTPTINPSDDGLRSYGMSVRCMSTCTHAAAPVGIIGDDTVCAGGTYTYSIAKVPNATAYVWALPAGWTGISNSDSITVVAGSGGGNISVQARTSCDTSAAQLMMIHISAPDALITVNGFELATTVPYVTYQWYLNSIRIMGATQSTYTVTQNGCYTVVVTDMYGCRDSSEVPKCITNVSVQAVNGQYNAVNVYPNPAQDVVYISTATPVNVVVRSIDGKAVIQQTETKQVSIGNLSDGIYIMYITDSNGELLKIEKLTKARQ